jgi:hypothetical protein
MIRGIVWLVEQNVHGGYTVYGSCGIRQYYGYSKSEAITKYKELYNKEYFTEVK